MPARAHRRSQTFGSGEGLALEFKETAEALPKRFFESVCAFLNLDGGLIVLGVADNGEVAGVNPAASGRLPFAEIAFPHRPHLHQARVFDRLCGDPPRSTLTLWLGEVTDFTLRPSRSSISSVKRQAVRHGEDVRRIDQFAVDLSLDRVGLTAGGDVPRRNGGRVGETHTEIRSVARSNWERSFLAPTAFGADRHLPAKEKPTWHGSSASTGLAFAPDCGVHAGLRLGVDENDRAAKGGVQGGSPGVVRGGPGLP